ncbi:MAG: hypothetical protein FWG85_07750 [Bacteroidetes bacterium]|nr:hypothetical protein [Bacteroidota bacterium]
MRIFFITTLIGLLMPQFIIAENKLQDVVYLKNGSIIRGTIMEIIPDQTIKIESGNNLFVYKMEEISEIKKEKIPDADSDNANKKTKNFLSGNLNFIGFVGGFYPGIGLSYESMVSDKISIGGELGVDVYILPYCKFRTRWYPTGKTFYTELDVGFIAFIVPAISPYIGWKIDAGKPNDWFIDLRLGTDLSLITGYFLPKVSCGFTYNLK